MGFQSFLGGWFLFLYLFIYFEASEVVFQLMVLKV